MKRTLNQPKLQYITENLMQIVLAIVQIACTNTQTNSQEIYELLFSFESWGTFVLEETKETSQVYGHSFLVIFL